MKFKLKNTMIEIEPDPASSSSVKITDWGDIAELRLAQTGYISVSILKRLFEPADSEALNFIDPDRDERIGEG